MDVFARHIPLPSIRMPRLAGPRKPSVRSLEVIMRVFSTAIDSRGLTCRQGSSEEDAFFGSKVSKFGQVIFQIRRPTKAMRNSNAGALWCARGVPQAGSTQEHDFEGDVSDTTRFMKRDTVVSSIR